MLPSFRVNKEKLFNYPKSTSDILVYEQDENGDQIDSPYIINKFLHSQDLTFGHDPNKKSLFLIEEDSLAQDVVIIKKDFIIGLINLEILTDFGMPFVYVAMVKRDDFFKK